MKKDVLTLQYLSSFCMSLYLVMQAGIPLFEGIRMLSEDEKDSARQKMLNEVAQKLEDGSELNVAIGSVGVFPKYVVDMTEIGERTGNLDRVLRSMSEYYDRQEQISQSIKNAILYPAILLVVMFFVIVVLVTNVLPVFNDVYVQLGGQMSPAAAAIMNFGVAVGQNWLPIVIVLAVLAAIALACRFVQPLKSRVSAFFARVRSSKSIGAMVAYTRFAAVMAMTMSSGMDIDESLAMAGNLTEDVVVQGKIEKCRSLMSAGGSFESSVTEADILPALYCRMLTIGVKTGSADDVMSEIARRSEVQVNDKIESIIGKVEPTLVIVMSVVVGLILMSVMLPLVNIMSTIG